MNPVAHLHLELGETEKERGTSRKKHDFVFFEKITGRKLTGKIHHKR